MVMYLLMLYVCFYVPMQVAFEIDYPVWQLAIDYVIDVLFIVDIFFMFRTTFYNSRPGAGAGQERHHAELHGHAILVA